MTREELRDYVDEQRILNNIPYHVYSALIDGIDTLEQEPSISEIPNNCDLISRKVVLENAFAIYTHECGLVEVVGVDTIKDLPSIKPQEKMGYWINIEDRTDWYDVTYKCSCCGREIITPYELKNNLYSDYPYCHCGTRMVKPQKGKINNVKYMGR